jgi:hypothetical protein
MTEKYISGSGKCGNCENDCCCGCRNKEKCHYCKENNNKPTGWFYNTRCCEQSYTEHYICFECNHGFKKSLVVYPSKKKNSVVYSDCKCNKCGNQVIKVPPNIRFPKANDIAQWSLLKKLMLLTPFEKCKKGTLGDVWYNYNGFCFTMHMPREERIQFNIPHHIRDYDEWIINMKSKKFIAFSKKRLW